MKKILFLLLFPICLLAQQKGGNTNLWYPMKVDGLTTCKDSFAMVSSVSDTNKITADTLRSIRLWGNCTVYEDIRIDGLSLPSNTDEPALTTGFAGSSLLWQRVFQGSTRDDKVYFNIQLPHAWEQGGVFELHIHNAAWTNPVAGDTVVWQLNYNWQNINGTYTTPTTVIVKQPVAGTVQWKHNLTELVRFNSSGKTLSSILVCSLYRLANSNASDTYTGGMTVLYIDGHYEVDSMGSDGEVTKD